MDCNLREQIFFSSNYHGNVIQNRISHSTNARSIYSQRSPIYQLVLNFLASLQRDGSLYLSQRLLALGPATAGPGAPDFTLRDPELLPTSGRHLEMIAILFVVRWGIEPRAFSPQLFQCDGPQSTPPPRHIIIWFHAAINTCKWKIFFVGFAIGQSKSHLIHLNYFGTVFYIFSIMSVK